MPEILKSLKHEYLSSLDWLIPFPGDWHMLMNYQIALMKPYFNAGLKHIAQAAGYPTKQLEKCSQFKRTHIFLLEVYEAMYRVMLESFIKQQGSEHMQERAVQSILI